MYENRHSHGNVRPLRNDQSSKRKIEDSGSDEWTIAAMNERGDAFLALTRARRRMDGCVRACVHAHSRVAVHGPPVERRGNTSWQYCSLNLGTFMGQ